MARLGYIQLLRVCQQACRFCSNPSNGAVLDDGRARAHIDDLVRLGYDGVVFTGGEPTLHERLAEHVAAARALGLHTRIITNGQRFAEDAGLAPRLARAGLDVAHVSIHSHRADVHDVLTQTPGALAAARTALGALDDAGVAVHVNTVLNRYNAGHLHEAVADLHEAHPFIAHHVFNGLDPRDNRASHNPDTIPSLRALEVSLHRALAWLAARGRTFRVERVPLCYMVEFADCSTETRKIVKNEERLVRFLDWKGLFRQVEWTFGHVKAPACARCSLDGICAGLWEGGRYYDVSELTPVFVDPAPIVARIGCRPPG